MVDIVRRHVLVKMDDPIIWIILGLLSVVFFDTDAALPVIKDMIAALLGTLPYIIFAVMVLAGLKSASAERVVARAFSGPAWRMIVVGAMVGGLSPFCSCEVIPFIATLLALGVPLAAVMAFWIASPLMDPGMFMITAGGLGWDFAIAKAIAAVGMGLLGGIVTYALMGTALFADPLKTAQSSCGSCCGHSHALPVKWRFWQESTRRVLFRDTMLENAKFLMGWLALAYLLQALMLRYVPAELVQSLLGGTGLGAIVTGALVGIPAYLNGYAAVPLVSTLLSQGMGNGVAMSFMLAGGVSCIPAAIAVWALVKPRVFVAYIALAFAGSVIAGMVWQVF